MSKTTLFLIILLLLATGGFFYVKYEIPDNPLLTAPAAKPLVKQTKPETALSFSTEQTTLTRGQTITVAVLVKSASLDPTLAQLEIAYDPTVLTELGALPGTYFTRPTVLLEDVSSDTGRISYALKCPMQQNSNKPMNCANPGANTLATFTFLVNPMAQKEKTTLAFLPKTVVRTGNGVNILGNITNLDLKLSGAVVQVASPAGLIIPTPK